MSRAPAASAAQPRERTRVLVLIDSVSAIGGAERLALETALRLDPTRYEVALCATRVVAPGAAEAAAAAGVGVVSLARTRTVSPLAWVRLARFVRRNRIEVLHAHKFGSNVWGAIVGRLARVPVVVAHEHSWAFTGEPVRRALDRHVVGRLADAIVAVSAEDARRMVELEGLDATMIRVIPNGIAPLEPSGRDVRVELGIPADAPVVGTVTVLRPEKALDVLIDAIALVREDEPNVRLVVAGDGPERPRLEQLARERGLGGAALFLGERRDVPDVLQALDVAVICSVFEGTPLALLEYMAAGLAIVATDVGGIPAVTRDREHALLVPPRDRAALASAVAELLASPDLRSQLGDAARERQRREFALDTVVERTSLLYEELLAGG